jgi:hypothetical protein
MTNYDLKRILAAVEGVNLRYDLGQLRRQLHGLRPLDRPRRKAAPLPPARRETGITLLSPYGNMIRLRDHAALARFKQQYRGSDIYREYVARGRVIDHAGRPAA